MPPSRSTWSTQHRRRFLMLPNFTTTELIVSHLGRSPSHDPSLRWAAVSQNSVNIFSWSLASPPLHNLNSSVVEKTR